MEAVLVRDRRARRLGLVAAGLLGVIVGAPVFLVPTAVHAVTSATSTSIPGAATTSSDPTPVQLDADIYRPAETPAPAVVLAHGFGGSKQSVAEQAQFLADRGFVVVAYSARGFGASTGLISMNAPQFEVADAARIVDFLAKQSYVSQEETGDPIVGFAGGSYGGALALLAAGYDDRVDAIAADITWNDLESSLFGQSVQASPGQLSPVQGVFKELWSGLFFSAGLTSADGKVTTCGRFSPDWCEAYSAAAAQGVLTARGRELMAASSPRSVTDRITVPTLLGGGQADSLFPLQQVNANAEQIMRAHPSVPVKVVWHAGGHDGGVNESDRLRELTAQWFTEFLSGSGARVADGAGSTDFEVSMTDASAVSDRAAPTVEVLSAPSYPGLRGSATSAVNLAGPPQQVLAPAGGVPAALSSLPGAGGLASLAGSLVALPLPNQTATFVAEPAQEPLRIVGSPQISLTIASEMPQREAVLFASVRVIGPTGVPSLPNGLVAPIRITDVGPTPVTVTVDLPAIVRDVAAGEQLAVVVGTTDQAYRLPSGPAVYTVGLAAPVLSVPTVDLSTMSADRPLWMAPLLGVLALIAIIVVVTWLRPRRGSGADRADLTEVPIAVDGLTKRFRSKVTAVDHVSFQVPPGVVLGLLGPNGAGKTTTMRMVMGLIAPTDGDAFIFGERVHPGAPAIANIGSFIEGPGFLPHLTGRANLDLYWRASGRGHQDPHLDEVLEIAGLGSAIDRKVRTYSQGMRQRLGIAQAMLGLPDILVLDEPTNGLDPPQIREMRTVLKQYVTAGRTVIISSHLLSEVEQTCSHVVVMHRGTVIAQGTVADLLSGRSGARLEDVFMEIVGEGHEVVSS